MCKKSFENKLCGINKYKNNINKLIIYKFQICH